jgi:putative transposase
VSASAHYHRTDGQRSVRAVGDERLLERIRELHAANYHAYGYRRMWKCWDEPAGRDRVKWLMGEHQIVGAKRRGRPWRTAIAIQRRHAAPTSQRDFSAIRPDALWLAEFTYLRCWEGVAFFSLASIHHETLV